MITLDLSGRTGAIFGVANHRSLAWAIAQRLHSAGARLAFSYAGDRLKEKVEALASPLEGSLVFECDVTNDDAIARSFRQIGESFGKLDYLVHSVAFANKEDLEGAFLDTSRAGFHLAMDVSAYSLVRLAKEAAPLLEKEGGSIVTLTYMASQRVIPGYGGGMSSAKAALEADTRTLAFEAGRKWGVRVNAISAGPYASRAASAIGFIHDMIAYCSKNAPLQEPLEAHEVGRTAAFLLSPLASAITGTTVYVDKGYHAMGMAVTS